MLAGFVNVGAVPLTRKCLSDEKVRIEINVDGDESESAAEKRTRLVENQLSACVSYLQLSGFMRADLLLVPAKRKQPRSERHVTLAHSLERQLAILQAKTTGAKYVAMDGTHLTHDDMFIVDEIRRRRDVVKGLEAEKRSRLAAAKRTTEALALIGSKEAEGCRVEQLPTDQKKWTNTELDVLLRWRNGGKVPPAKKEAKVAEWQRLRRLPLPLFAEWTDDDEQKLQALESDVAVEDTELGRERRRLIQDASASFALLSEAQRNDLMAKFCADSAARHSTLAIDNLGGDEKTGDFVNESERNESDKPPSNRNRPTRCLPARFRE